MKTIKGKLMSVLLVLTFILLFAAAAAGVAAGRAGIGGALGVGALAAVAGTVVIGIVAGAAFGKVLAPVVQLKLFATGDFSEESSGTAKIPVAEGFRDEAQEVMQAAKSVRKQIRETIIGTSQEAANIAETASAAYSEMAELNNTIDEWIRSRRR